MPDKPNKLMTRDEAVKIAGRAFDRVLERVEHAQEEWAYEAFREAARDMDEYDRDTLAEAFAQEFCIEKSEFV